uniref:Putative secreted protein n=1 Tax=Nyssomyia neivai TaxID=330878 RepID=A0A1L8DNQ6_9DIPT
MNMALMPLVATTVTVICNLSASMCTTMRHLVANTFHVLFSLILSLVRWIRCVRVHLGRSSGPIILSLGNPVPVITGLRGTTPKVLSSLIPFWMLYARRLNHVIASRDSS